MEMNLQIFGGRGGASGKQSGGSSEGSNASSSMKELKGKYEGKTIDIHGTDKRITVTKVSKDKVHYTVSDGFRQEKEVISHRDFREDIVDAINEGIASVRRK